MTIALLGLRTSPGSHFTAHCGCRAVRLAVLLVGGSSRAMLASTRSLIVGNYCNTFYGQVLNHEMARFYRGVFTARICYENDVCPSVTMVYCNDIYSAKKQ